jgi:hypothetical protein
LGTFGRSEGGMSLNTFGIVWCPKEWSKSVTKISQKIGSCHLEIIMENPNRK